MDILITGIHGFVGNCLTDALGGRHRLYGLDIVQPARKGVAHTYGWDELDSLPPVDAVIHLAAIAHDVEGRVPDDKVMQVNTGLTKQIFDKFMADRRIGQFIYFSSCSVFADPAVMQRDVLDENTPVSPTTAYGRSKVESERYINDAVKNATDDLAGRKVYIVRPAMIYGHGAKGNLRLLHAFVRHGMPWPLGAFDNSRTFVSATNVQYVIGRMLEGDVPADTYMLADDESLSTNRLVTLIAESLGRRARIMHVPRGIIRAMVAMGDIMHLPLNKARFAKLTGNCIVSNARLRRALGIGRMPVAADDAMRDTLKSL
ncbi:MAG: NAD-dependent epimerase/dehydratase family protein [Bacteroidales bacterium]|nr:NAD-dependent epimerase/dehydratase family protein [Bacteroidales bacterium]